MTRATNPPNRYMSISVVVTVKNEERYISDLIESLLLQSYPPKEIIIVDGGSTDETIEIINQYIRKGGATKLIVEPGANVAKGRNLGVENATSELIATTNVRCKPCQDWLASLVNKFDSTTDVVAGVYFPYGTLFERCVGETLFPKEKFDKIHDDDFLPSTRSLAFKKSAWQKVGGFDESVPLADDTVFDLKLKKAGCKFKMAKDAIVYYRPSNNLKDFFWKNFRYAEDDARGGTLYLRKLFLFRSTIVFVLFVCLFLFSFKFASAKLSLLFFSIALLSFLLYKGISVYGKVGHFSAVLLVPLIILTYNLGWYLGLLYGLRELMPKSSSREAEP